MTADRWRPLLTELYDAAVAEALDGEIEHRVQTVRGAIGSPTANLDECDAWLITYADQFQEEGETPLQVLRRFLDVHATPWISGVHVLPFYEWSSDDGFSVTDYMSVDPAYGGWEDVRSLADGRLLMADAVINHMSAESDWFRGFLSGDPEYAGFFRTASPDADLTATVRPRITPLLTEFAGHLGSHWVWTTFSADQVDLDYRNPQVLLRVIDVLLHYVRHGARAIRLDAVGFLWKEEGTTSLHLPQTHLIVHMLRLCLEQAAPGTLVVTETNVPHEENVSYFGSKDRPEAHLVYQFPLAPLVLDAMRTGDATVLSEWAAQLGTPLPDTSFLNFLASHDGVGVRPAEGLLAPERIAALADLSRAAGGGVGERTTPDGEVVPYELNSTWFDLMAVGYDESAAIGRHLASHAVMLALPGVPLIYVHSLFGSPNDAAGFAATGRPRSYNRHKFASLAALEARLANPDDRAARLLAGMRELVAKRGASPAFHPCADHEVLDSGSAVFAIMRRYREHRTVVAVNISGNRVAFQPPDGGWTRIGSSAVAEPIDLGPWQSAWLQEL